MATHTVTVGENGRLEIICRREDTDEEMSNATVTSVEGEVSVVIDELDPGESVEVAIIGATTAE